MQLVDSHCHLQMLEGDLAAILKRAEQAGVLHILCVATDLEELTKILDIASRFSAISASVGLHPSEAHKNPSITELLNLASHPKIVALGETGLDCYRGRDNFHDQQQQFRQHIHVAKTLHKPLIIHTRAAKTETLAILKEERAYEVGGVLHCFTEDWEMASAAIDLGFYISISGIVTFKNAIELQQVAKKIPSDRLLIETDAPYLAPQPMRGKSNEPAFVRYTAEYLAALRGVDIAVLAEKTTENFFKLFPLSV